MARDNPSCYRKVKKNAEDYKKRRGEEGEKKEKVKTKDEKRTIQKAPHYNPESGNEEEDDDEDGERTTGK